MFLSLTHQLKVAKRTTNVISINNRSDMQIFWKIIHKNCKEKRSLQNTQILMLSTDESYPYGQNAIVSKFLINMSIGTQPKALLNMIVFVKESTFKDQFLIPIIFLRRGGIRNLNQTMTIANPNLKKMFKIKIYSVIPVLGYILLFYYILYGVSRQI